MLKKRGRGEEEKKLVSSLACLLSSGPLNLLVIAAQMFVREK